MTNFDVQKAFTDNAKEITGLAYLVLNDLLGLDLDGRVKAALESDEDLLKATYAHFHEIGTENIIDKAKIDELKLAESLNVQARAALLLDDFFGMWPFEKFEKGESFSFADVSELRESGIFKELNESHHLLAPADGLNMDVDFFERKAPAFPLPTKARLVLDRDLSLFAMNILKKSAAKAGKEVKVLLPGELATVPPPGPKDCHIVLSPSAEDLNEKLNWELIALYAAAWEEEIPLVGLSSELVAAIHVYNGMNPNEACALAHLNNPDSTFLASLHAPRPINEFEESFDEPQ
ncbi:hypothetical protein IPG41_01770 [Candidatus Peregrinibacteria bacterium]|nr:MAG: hypothetical protein IPG41_01770 [Candidatus Peregrinibacteria bacterium]